MILSLLTDDYLMKDKTSLQDCSGYDMFTRKVLDDHPANTNCGEVHTSDIWKDACTRFCGSKGKHMLLALIVFWDKTHANLHGSLSVTPVVYSLTLFNCATRNNPRFWRPLSYILKLCHVKGKADLTGANDKVQNEHKYHWHECIQRWFENIC